MRVISASFVAVLLCLTVVSLPAPVRGESLRRPTPDSLARPQALVHKLGLDVSPGALFRTDDFFKGANAAGKEFGTTLSVHLKYAFQFGPETRFGRNYPFTYQGVGLGYNTFFNSAEVGTPVALYVFQHARIAALAERLSLDYEWNFGASFGWKKYDGQYNPQNEVIGSKINAYINLGFILNWQLHPQWKLAAGVDFTHFSNGNTHYPNGGLNVIGGRVGIVRTFGDADETLGTVSPKRVFIKPHVSYDLVIYGATRKRGFVKDNIPSLVPGSFGIAGLNFAPMYNFNNYFRAGLSVDAQYDESANIKDYKLEGSYSGDLKFHRPPFREQFAVGLSLRAELVMPIFSINAGLGRNLVCHGDDTQGFYQILALKTYVTRHLFLHVGYQLSKFKDPNNLMLGLGYRFHNKR